MSAEKRERLLLLETSGRVGRVGLAEQEKLVAERQLDAARRHARDLAPAVRDLLKRQGWRPKDISAILVSSGPGSYTGLRVGTMSAKAFAYATGCRILGIDTFAAIASQARPASTVEVIADAQQDKVYHQSFIRSDDGLTQATMPLRVLTLDHWLAELAPGGFVTGPGLETYQDRLPTWIELIEAAHWHPRLESLLRVGRERLRRGEADDLLKLEPLYLRPSSAEENWPRRKA